MDEVKKFSSLPIPPGSRFFEKRVDGFGGPETWWFTCCGQCANLEGEWPDTQDSKDAKYSIAAIARCEWLDEMERLDTLPYTIGSLAAWKVALNNAELCRVLGASN